MNVLSLFDGMSCGMIALKRAGIKVDSYYASEIDKHATIVSQVNYPDIIRLGDVQTINYQMLPKIDLLIGGSPCQGFSFAGKHLNFSDPRSALFFEFVHALKTVKPKYFMLENVRMKKEYQDAISKLLGVEPININSNLVSAQNRNRWYWTNIPNIQQPEDKCIFLKDILDNSPQDVKCGAIRGRYIVDGKRQDHKIKTAGLTTQTLETRKDNKSGCLTTVQKDNVLILLKGRGNNPGGLRALDGKVPSMTANSWQENNHLINIKNYNITSQKQIRKNSKKEDTKSIALCANSNVTGSGVTTIDLGDNIHYRKLTPIECERLQTIPDNFTNHVSNSQRYKMIGNGWTIDVITHILNYIED